MYDKGKILVGVVLFLAVFTIPFWYSQATGDADYQPNPDTSELLAAGKTCVEPLDYMASKHMDLLDNWRNEVVRGADREYVSKEYGTVYDKSLTDTCLQLCHDNKADFCDQCHNYVAVEPNCWDCHNIVEGE